jgi:hypothetical protein
MRGQLGYVERMGGFAPEFAQGNAIPDMHGHAALQVGQAEGYSSVSTIGSAQDGKQGLFLGDGQ